MIKFKEEVLEALNATLNFNSNDIERFLSSPPKKEMGDLSFPCFLIAKEKKEKPAVCAKQLSEKIKNNFKFSYIDKVVNFGPYINFFIKQNKFFNEFLSKFLEKGICKRKNNKKNVIVEFSSPNIAKPIAFHHIRSTVIGNVISNLFEHCGYNVQRINYLGDWGTQFGKLITAFEKFGSKEEFSKKGVKHLLDIYIKYHKNENKKLSDKAQYWFEKTEAGDKKALDYWNSFRDVSIKEFKRIYERLGVKFTSIEGESFYKDKVDETLFYLEKKIGLKESQGAIIIDLEKFDMPPVLLKKTNGTTLYATRDIAAAIDRWERFNFTESLYVVANQQELHFKQLFKSLELAGFNWFKSCKHISFGLLRLEDSKMSTREGNIIFLEDVLNKSINLAKKAIEEKNPDLENKENVAEDIGIGAIIFNDISKRRAQDIVFKWDEVLNFDGETAPYIQYSYARASSILDKINVDFNNISKEYEASDLEYQLIKQVSLMENKIDEAKNSYEPFILARYTLDLAKLFNKYYYQEKIKDIKDEKIKNTKAGVIFTAKETMKYCLLIMGIKAPERI
jgi:arginyl-tRNA synthetase